MTIKSWAEYDTATGDILQFVTGTEANVIVPEETAERGVKLDQEIVDVAAFRVNPSSRQLEAK